ncbi:MAG: phosphate ABC transporter substrate-binding protein [Clostridiales bacterium]|nr:phosphate ABC transporter substrate-binding protein [Clostridiales bacterium]
MKIKNFVKKAFVVTCCISMMGAMLSGCGKKDDKTVEENKTVETNKTTEDKKLTGTITMVGSTSMEKLALAVAEDYMAKNSGVTVNAEFVGSGAGIEAVINGTANIGNSSRNLKEEEKAAGAVENIVAIDGIAVVVNKANTVKAVTKDQLVGIYTGTIKNWSELGGNDSPIVVIGRESGSGTRGAFEEILKVEDQCVYANELDNTGAVMAQVAATEGAIGYVSLDVVDDTVNALAYDGADATAENVKSGIYSLSRPFVMATKGEITEQSELVQAFFDYLKSEEGKAIIQQVGLVTVD